MSPEDRVEAVRDSLLNAEAWTGGRVGVMDLRQEDELRAYMTGRGWLGPASCLTQKGAAEAHRIQQEAGWL